MTDHAKLRSRVLAHATGLLDPDAQATVLAHLEACAECRQLAESLADQPDVRADPAHIPSAIVADWPRASAALVGFERRMIQQHLDRCTECRADLEAMGYSAEMSPESATRAGSPSLASLSPAHGGRSIRGLGTPGVDLPRPRFGPTLLVGGWAALATAAAVILAIRSNTQEPAMSIRPVPAPQSTDPANATDIGDPSTGVRSAIVDLPPPIVLKPVLRGASTPLPAGRPDATGRFLSVTLAAQPMERSEVSSVRLEVSQPDGSALVEQEGPPSAFVRSRTLLLDAGDERWTNGRYTLRLVFVPTASALLKQPEVRAFDFQVSALP